MTSGTAGTVMRAGREAAFCAAVLGARAALAMVAAAGTKPAEAAFPGKNGKIAFASDRDGTSEIYRLNQGGTNQQNLTSSAAIDITPAYSPGGKSIAFTSIRDGNHEIYTMNADGTGIRRLTISGAADFSPAWSPDGKKIAFQSNRTGNAEVFVMNPDGTRAMNLTFSGATDSSPAWSPDGRRITFESDRDGNSEIYRMSATGAFLPTRLTFNTTGDFAPSWQPLP